MTTTWQIGESGTAVTLDPAGRGEVTFTVTNAGTAPGRAVLTITPLDGAVDAWFTVPEPQRPVAAGASVVYPVGVAVPPDTAQGLYGLQGVAYSADGDPGESSAMSKRVNLSVTTATPKKGIPRWVWLVVAAAVLLVVGVVIFLLTRGDDSPLRNERLPEVEGTAAVGETLTADAGSWSKDLIEIDYQWQYCHEGDEVCDDLQGQTGREMLVTLEHQDHEIRVEVTATAGGGGDVETATARSGPSELVPTIGP